MKKLIYKLIAVAAMAFIVTPCVTQAQNSPSREHRSMWMTPFLGQNWPSSAITSGNANRVKTILDQQLDSFRDQNVNVLYYHCRSMCDATYDSAYEPWSRTVSGTRGVAPPFDPFGYLVESAHARGIEVYAWINPYRYCSTTKYGDQGGDLNYENSHPDWLISQAKETILNPGLEEVKQRIVDVIVDIITKYDVDGVVFDDYFYTSNTPMNLDADLYNKYKNGGGTLSQADWRRANVNEMVSRVNKAIKDRKPWVVFGISPAGVASPPNVTSEYGLPAAPGGGDWQYNGIYSDPLAWYKQGIIDFMSPQIYWPGRFAGLSEWWANAAVKFGRHCYPSIDMSSIDSPKYEEVAAEIEQTRNVSPEGTAGFVFFHYGDFVNYSEKWEGKTTTLGKILANDVWNSKALVPLRPWVKSTMPEMVTNVKSDGKTLTWDANAAGRYAIYKFPKNQTSYQLTLDGISYTNSYAMPSDADNFNWFVAAYDRYANVTAPLGVGATKQTGTAPELTYPANGENPVDLFEFAWQHESNLEIYTVEVARDAAFNDMVGIINVNGKSASVTQLPPLTDGKTYYWRVRATDVNREHPLSEVRSFVAPHITIKSPASSAAGLSTSPSFTWSKAVDNADYTLKISTKSDMSVVVHSATVKTTSYTVPARTLTSGTKYYASVTAAIEGASSVSETVAFSTIDKNDYAAPVFVTPASSGVTLKADQAVTVQPWEGMVNITINISDSETFPARTAYTYTLSNFATSTPELSTIKISSKNLVAGTKYYVRARGAYNLTTSSSTQYTDYTPLTTFIYSDEAGIDNVESDGTATSISADGILHVGDGGGEVRVYTLAGALVLSAEVGEGGELSLENLPAGAYIVTVGSTTLKYIR